MADVCFNVACFFYFDISKLSFVGGCRYQTCFFLSSFYFRSILFTTEEGQLILC